MFGTLFNLVIGLIVIFALILVVRRILRGPQLDDRLVAYASLPELERRRSGPRSRSWLVRLRLRLNTALAGLSSEEMAINLMSADWPITPAEYTLIRYLGTGILLVFGWVTTQNPLVGIGLAIVAYLIPGIALRYAINRRRRLFEKQLVDVLVLITGAVRAGFSLLQAMEVVVRELGDPASEEFRRTLQEVSLGRPLAQALENMTLRMANRDLDLLVTAIKIQYTVGGNLTTMLEAVTETIRERIRLFGEVRALTSQQRFSAYIISLLPFFVMAGMFIISPFYIRQLFNRQYIFIPVLAGVLMLIGFIVIQRMARIDV